MDERRAISRNRNLKGGKWIKVDFQFCTNNRRKLILEYSALRAQTSLGRKRETNKDLVLNILKTIGRDEEFHTQYIGIFCLFCYFH